MDQQQSQQSPLTLAGAIIIAGAIIAIAIIWVKSPAKTAITTDDKTSTSQAQTAAIVNLSPITAADHILGNPNAQIRIVEYSDPSCVYCKAFQPTMVAISDQYGPSGKVAWVYRSFPLKEIHPNAEHESEAFECVASIGGNEKFWAYQKYIYSIDTTGTSGLDQKRLPIIAKEIGLDVSAFNTCLSSGKFASKVAADSTSGVNAGVSGTPSTFFVLDKQAGTATEKFISDSLISYHIPSDYLHFANDKKLIVVSGALPKALLTGLINSILGN